MQNIKNKTTTINKYKKINERKQQIVIAIAMMKRHFLH